MLTKRFLKTQSVADITFEHACDENTQLTSNDDVELMAEFNGWQPIKMKYIKKVSAFRAKVRLPQNKQFHFRYRVNQQNWHNEHFADDYIENTFGTDNCIVSTRNVVNNSTVNN